MVSSFFIADIVRQMLIAIPSIIVGTQTITAAINGYFNVEKPIVKQIISWVIAVLAGVGFVVFNGMSFISGPVWLDMVIGGFAGLLAGAAANGFYDFDPVHKILKMFSELFKKENN